MEVDEWEGGGEIVRSMESEGRGSDVGGLDVVVDEDAIELECDTEGLG